jgi:hypothetical protein
MAEDHSISPISYVVYFGAVVISVVLSRILRSFDEKSSAVKKAQGWPLLGSALDFLPNNMLPSFISYPKMLGKVIELYMIFDRFILITDPTLSKDILAKRPKYFRRFYKFDYGFKTLEIAKGLFGANGSQWSTYRRLTARPSTTRTSKAIIIASINKSINGYKPYVRRHY